MVDPREHVPFVGRLGELDTASRALASEGHGVVVHGAPGTGTTAFAQRVVESLGPDVVVLHLRGSVGAAEVPYGAIMPILRDGDPSSLAHPLQVLRTAVEHVAAAGGGRVVLVVHGAQLVDPMSALVLASLGARRECSLLLVADAVRGLPADLGALVREGALASVEIGPFTIAEVGVYASARFDRRVAPLLARMLWQASAGRVRSLAALVDRIQADPNPGGLLHRWRVGRVPPLEAALPTALAWLTPAERALVDTLALAGTLPLPLVQKVTEPGVVESVLARRLVTLDPRPGQPLRVSDPVLATAVRGLVGVGQRLSLLNAAFPDGDPEDPDLALAYARWAASCGTPVAPACALLAAQAAMDEGDPESALAVLDAAGPQGGQGAAVLRVVALALLGRATAASAVLAGLRLVADDPAAEQALTWALAAAPDLAIEEGAPPTAVAVALRASAPRAWRGLPPAAAVDACAALAEGDARAAVDPLLAEAVRVLADPSPWRDVVAWRAVEAAALTGTAVPDVVAAVAAEATGPSGSTRDGRTHGALSATLLDLLRCAPGDGAAAASAVDVAVPGREPEDAAPPDLAVGFAALAAGHAADAAQVLGPLATLVDLLDPAGARPAVLAAWAVAAALADDAPTARAALDGVAAAPAARWFPGRVAQVLALAARLALHDADAVRLTAAAAAEEQAAGRPLTATSLYVSALLAGSTEAADPLAVAAAQVHDWSGELGRRLAAGVRDRAADDLVDLATQAEGRGCLEIALLVAGTAARVARGGDDAEVLRRAQSLEARLAARSSRGSTRGARGAALHRLTPREQEIARLILHGAGNQTVAQTLHLSVRTVEGHLSRIYTKLAIGGREELAALLG